LAGLVDLETTADEMRAVLDAVARRRLVVSVAQDPTHTVALGASALGRELAASDALLSGLSKREQEVLELLRQGASDKDIGSRLGISPHTVGNRVRGIEAKLAARTRFELGMLAARFQRIR
jgi:DNA-binding CsgD family transcriptional regulator